MYASVSFGQAAGKGNMCCPGGWLPASSLKRLSGSFGVLACAQRIC